MSLFSLGLILGLAGLLSLILGFVTDYAIFTDTKLVSLLAMLVGVVTSAFTGPRF